MRSTAAVLVVDDDDSIREFMALALADEGYQVLTALHGQEALDLAVRAQPDLILLDMRMPVMDGWEFSQAYRQAPGPHAPIVVITAGRNAAANAEEIGAAGFLAKPFELGDLLNIVAEHTRQERWVA